MKYIILSFLFLSLTSCTIPFSEKRNTQTNTSSNIHVGSVQISDSGVSVSTHTGNISIGPTENVIMSHESGSMSMGSSGVVSVGTGIKIPVEGNNHMDPEVENITKDIDKIFEDIGK